MALFVGLGYNPDGSDWINYRQMNLSPTLNFLFNVDSSAF